MTDPAAGSEPQYSIGIAGWSYPDWMGYVYDRSVRDPLAFLARYVDMIEINSTFYRPATPRQAESWLRRTSAKHGFFFTAKLSREFTHENERDEALMARFLEGLMPLAEASKLHAVLAQFRYDFADNSDARDLLTWIAERTSELSPLVFEFRHRSWQQPQALEFVRELGASVAHLDYPMSRTAFDLDVSPVGTIGYFRLHGRNADAWFDAKAGRDETYNYYYPENERQQLVQRARRIAAHFRSLTIVANNHYQGKEVANALQIKASLTGQKVSVPIRLLDRYPELQHIANDDSLREWQASRSQQTAFGF